jgi:hypothetical protein
MSSKPKRIRAGNFSAEEKEMTLTFVQEHSVVLESKAADPNIKKKEGVVGRTDGENEESGLSSISFKVEGFPQETGGQNQHYPI